jgi:hypothetical protein
VWKSKIEERRGMKQKRKRKRLKSDNEDIGL